MLEKCQPCKQLIAGIEFCLIHLSQYVFSIIEVMKFSESKSALFMTKDTPVFFFFLPCSVINPIPLYSESIETLMAFSHQFSLQQVGGNVVSVARKTKRSQFFFAFFPLDFGALKTTMS